MHEASQAGAVVGRAMAVHGVRAPAMAAYQPAVGYNIRWIPEGPKNTPHKPDRIKVGLIKDKGVKAAETAGKSAPRVEDKDQPDDKQENKKETGKDTKGDKEVGQDFSSKEYSDDEEKVDIPKGFEELSDCAEEVISGDECRNKLKADRKGKSVVDKDILNPLVSANTSLLLAIEWVMGNPDESLKMVNFTENTAEPMNQKMPLQEFPRGKCITSAVPPEGLKEFHII
ncbi:hypothetical protein GUJ93_ZPchr0010g7882 [Zizania palustris]|uniref:Uncharacterized protein n=1 Tax=Zizania palustris TaxID=103762 RepID=A0A8J6BMR2_ZIZPA|nr:hypothetical protein GUJ93_ZPchr0010g7882 [Zizania palustris]